ncbi:MAG: DUF6049 family protein [Aeromicrobium sp.]|uniref:DUF6049 family protein n=1 Tax=Aeromicrobium sp. TaxID=1871063 RepID=UPI003C699820
MISRRRTTPAATGITVVAAVAVLLSTVAAAVIAPASPAVAADDDTLRTTIASVSPTHLTDASSSVTLAGRVTNLGEQKWTDVQAYLIIRPKPLTSRTALATAVREDPGFAGPRIVDAGLFDEIGDLPPGSSRAFEVSVPIERLPISNRDGVYPVGVQILATDASGIRSNESVSRAVTLLPHLTGKHVSAPTTMVWPFLMPTGRTATGEFVEPSALLAAIRPGGRLRNLLDLAKAREQDGSGVIVDPALVLGADDLAAGRSADDVSASDQQAAARFRDDLVSIGSTRSAWVLDFDRTDVLSLIDDADRRRRLFGAVERATESVIKEFGLSPHRVSWPVRGGVTRSLLSSLRARGDDPVVVDSSNLSRWEKSSGSLVAVSTLGGDLPLLVSSDVSKDLPGPVSGATLRQQVLSSAAFASLDRDANSQSQAASVVVVNPTWNPGSDDPAGGVTASWSAPFSTPVDLDAITRDDSFGGTVPRTSKARTLPAALLEAADQAYQDSAVLSSASDEVRAVDDARARAVAGVLGVRWRNQREDGAAIARRLSRDVSRDLDAISVMGPPSVTLSGSQGAFPLTITNGSTETVLVGVRLSSSNPALTLPDQDPVTIGAGERLTLTVEVDLRRQNATTVSAQLITPGGRPFGETSEFNVRSSRVGAVLWVTMAAAGLFVLVALARRVRKRRTDRPPMETGLDDD